MGGDPCQRNQERDPPAGGAAGSGAAGGGSEPALHPAGGGGGETAEWGRRVCHEASSNGIARAGDAG